MTQPILRPIQTEKNYIDVAVESRISPGEVVGLLQVNAVVPQGVGPGSAVPVMVSVGGIASQAGVTIAVK
jgi:uncharacterized protein (TIGR03437 family)